ncbi:ATP-grasp domain-containing protein [Hyphomonas johnsonii]|uniref:Prokaryotic glutathione synthetase ATP-binding domain-containing protein n=1 Tax=Hyphomonas johnsonii MHS-2 TaxID=1280950 RepID=A0A059FVA0_9PROT|nr:hypothetical protein [Hyphomonas johnsonii]KCZ94620.1 hypothetical protein HJO_04560 [Hyphomonas johnsonii MHS-2]
MKIAYLACSDTLPGSPTRRTDAFEHDHMMTALVPAFARLGMTVTDVSWDDPGARWEDYAAAIIGTTWDYWDRSAEFLDTLERIEGLTRLLNSPSLVRWNSRKTYLRELEARGVRLIPTLWVDRMSPDVAAGAFDTFGSDDLVFKRQIGAGAKDQHRLARGAPVPDMPHPMMVQPFLSTIQDEGELSFIFVDGVFSHALVKRAASGDYRIQSAYGGIETAITPTEADLGAARDVLGKLESPPLYARVDMLRGNDGALLLMELELIEPYLYPVEGPELGDRLAEAMARRLR